MKTTAKKATKYDIRAREGFGKLEEIAWEVERRADTYSARIFYKRFARTARSFHVQLNLADQSSDLLLPDACSGLRPTKIWDEIDRAARELDCRIPCPAAAIVALSLQDQLDSGRIDISGDWGRAIVATTNVTLTSEEREWIETYEPAVQERVDETRQRESVARVAAAAAHYFPQSQPGGDLSLEVFSETIKGMSPDELIQVENVLRCFYQQGFRARVAVTIGDLIQKLGLPIDRVREILAYLEKRGAIRPLPGKGQRWLALPHPPCHRPAESFLES